MSGRVVHTVSGGERASVRLVRWEGSDTFDGEPYDEWQVLDRSGVVVATVAPETLVRAAAAAVLLGGAPCL